MATRTQQMHQFLTGYLGPSSGPPTFGVPSKPLNARLPVSPGDGIPEGHRPIPTSSESNKKTNAQIPYVRQVYSQTGTAGLRFAPKEGDIVLVERTTINRKEDQPGARLGHGTNSYAYTRTIESLNTEDELLKERDEAYTYDSFPYRLDGVINNVDSEDPQNEFRDYTIANVAIYGPCRLDHGETTRCDFKKTHPGSILYVGLEAIEEGGRYKHRLVRFSSAQLSRGVHVLEPPGHTLVCAWALGMIMDSNQSKNMVTVFVNVSPIRTIDPNDPNDPNQIASTDDAKIFIDTNGKKHLVHPSLLEDPRWHMDGEVDEDGTLSAAEQLESKWQEQQFKRLLPRSSAAPPPDNDRPSASWH